MGEVEVVGLDHSSQVEAVWAEHLREARAARCCDWAAVALLMAERYELLEASSEVAAAAEQ